MGAMNTMGGQAIGTVETGYATDSDEDCVESITPRRTRIDRAHEVDRSELKPSIETLAADTETTNDEESQRKVTANSI